MDSEKTAPLPWIVQFIAALMVIGGTLGICNTVYKAVFLGISTLDLGSVLCLLLGHFLLRRGEAAYNITLVFIFLAQLGVIACLAISVIMMFSSGSLWIPEDSSGHSDLRAYVGSWEAIVMLATCIPFFLFFGYLIRVWHLPENVAIFTEGPKPKGTGNWSSILILIGLILGVSYSVLDYRCRRAVNQVYLYDASIRAVDSKTKEPVSDGLSIGTTAMNPADLEKNFGLQTQVSTSWGEDSWRIRGKSIEPVEVRLNADGYETATVTVGPGTETYTVEMERKK